MRQISLCADYRLWQLCLQLIAPDKALFSTKKYWYFSYFSTKNMLWYSLEAPGWGASNEYPQYMFSRRNKKNIILIPSLGWSYVFIMAKEMIICSGRNSLFLQHYTTFTKYWNSSSYYHTCPKIWTSTLHYQLMCQKNCWMSGK